MTASGEPHPHHFPQPTVRWAIRGALIGATSVMAVSVVLILVADESMTLLGVAALSAGFGGAGFGAMLGAVLAAIRAGAEDEAARAATRTSVAPQPSP